MNAKKLKYLLLIVILLTSVTSGSTQIILHSFIDLGENNASEGLFVKNGYRGSYQSQKYTIEGGMQLDLKSANPNTLTGFDLIGSREISMSDFPFEVKGFFMLNRFSDLLFETNWGVRLGTRKYDHFIFDLGINNRAYVINSPARDEFEIEKTDGRLNEYFNFTYLISAFLKPPAHHWNVGLSCTNVDYYVINQSTNPVFNLQMRYKPNASLSFYLDSWYKQAGMLNISANYFGYFFRGGVKWVI